LNNVYFIFSFRQPTEVMEELEAELAALRAARAADRVELYTIRVELAANEMKLAAVKVESCIPCSGSR
jgi:hypothetical protein